MRKIWLASYPKSGNTWMRALIAATALDEGEALDINKLHEGGPIACAREPFDHLTLIDSGLLTHDEIDGLRPSVYEAMQGGAITAEDVPDADGDNAIGGVRFAKTHDAYTYLPDGTPLLGGRGGADGAVLIVRDPRGVAPSLADHNGVDLDRAIAQLNEPETQYCAKPGRQHRQLRHRLLDWSGHARSWRDQNELPVHLVRYEDMVADTAEALASVLAFAGLMADGERIRRAVSLSAFSALREQETAQGFSEVSRNSHVGRFFRRGDASAWREELTMEHIALIESAHGTMMKELGYSLHGIAPRADLAIAAMASPLPRGHLAQYPPSNDKMKQ